MRKLFALTLILFAAGTASSQSPKRKMTFLDVMGMKQATSFDLSKDGSAVVFAVGAVNWKLGKSFTDVYVTTTDGGKMRQMTFTPDKNESDPRWSPAGRVFAFLSDRDLAAATSDRKNQLYIMSPDGGEARRLTDEKDGVERFEFSQDGTRIIYSAGKPGSRQLYIVSLDASLITKLTEHGTGIEKWKGSSDGKWIIFTSPNSTDKLELLRKEKNFDVRISNLAKPASQLWGVNIETKKEEQLTRGESYTVTDFEISRDGREIAFMGGSPDRYSTGMEAEVYLLKRESREVRRITENRVREGSATFSPDGKWLALSAPEGYTFMRNSQIYVVPVSGGELRPLIKGFDYDADNFFWEEDSKAIYFSSGVGVNRLLFVVSIEGGEPRELTALEGVVSVVRDEQDTGDTLIFSYTNPQSPVDLYAANIRNIADQSSWKRITDLNPEVKNLELGQYEVVRWKSSDGVMVEGLLVKPIGYRAGERYPLIVQLHGGPASAYLNSFSGNYGTYVHVFAGNGYAVFQPNYRGSSNYGERFKMEIAGDYFRQGFDDIMTGVDHLIELGVVDSKRMGMMGWSAGGHWSNWTLTHTNRFKAISSGAGAANWISMYAQTDVQTPREFYFKGLPYENWEHYLSVSPIMYIKNAKTPTLIHVGEADPRVPMPQSLELHMALRKLGIPTEMIVYPGMPHGLTNPRYQMVKMASEFAWFEKWIMGKTGWIDWAALMDTVKDEGEKAAEKSTTGVEGEKSNPK